MRLHEIDWTLPNAIAYNPTRDLRLFATPTGEFYTHRIGNELVYHRVTLDDLRYSGWVQEAPPPAPDVVPAPAFRLPLPEGALFWNCLRDLEPVSGGRPIIQVAIAVGADGNGKEFDSRKQAVLTIAAWQQVKKSTNYHVRVDSIIEAGEVPREGAATRVLVTTERAWKLFSSEAREALLRKYARVFLTVGP